MKLLLTLATIYLVSACSAVAPRSTAALVKGVEDYCAAVSLQARHALRDQANSELAARAKTKDDPAQIRGVHCPGDPE